MQNSEQQVIAAQIDYPAPQDSKRSSKRAFLVVLYFVTVVAVFFRAPLFFHRYFQIPYDLVAYHYPLSDFIAWSLREFHQLPWWNPFSYMGQPFFGNVQAAMFYPLTLLVVTLGNLLFGRLPFYLIELELATHVVIAGLGTYVLLRLMRISVNSAIAGGTIYCLGAFFASQAQHLGVVGSAAWLPWFLAGLYRLEQRRDLKSSALASVALALMILPGFPAGYLPVFVFGPLFYGAWMWQRYRRLEWRPYVRGILLFAISVLLAMALSAVSWLPSYYVGRHSVATLRPITQALDGIYPEAITSFFWPNMFGQLRGQVPQQENPTFLHLYQGIPALVLVISGSSWLLSRRKARPFLAAAVLGFLWMFGRFTFIAELMYLIYPQFVRRGIYPHYVMAYFSLAFAVLTAVVLNGREREEYRSSRLPDVCWWAAAVAGLVALLASAIGSITASAGRIGVSTSTLFWVAAMLGCCGLLLYRQRDADFLARGKISGALCLLIAVDLITVGSSNVMNTAPGGGQEQPQAVNWLKERLGVLPLYRIDTTGTWGSWQTRVPEFRVPSANGMDPLLLLDTEAYRAPFSSVSGRQFTITSFQSPLLDIAGIRYIVSPQREIPGTRLVYSAEANIFENSRAFPRFFLVGAVVPAADISTAVQLIDNRKIDPARVAVVSAADADAFKNLAGPANSAELGDLKLLSYSPNQLRLQVSTIRPAVMVAAETFWKDWHAVVDGRPQPIVRADGIFRAVIVPAGTHQITMFITPTILYVGGAISTVGLLLALLLIWWAPRKPDPVKPSFDAD
jgi:hypothetical protein